MSVSSVSSSSSILSNATTSKLTEAQKTKIKQILSKYDKDNFDITESKKLLKEIGDTGIPVNKDLLNLLNQSGFDVIKVAESGNTDSSTTSSAASTESVTSLLQEYKDGKITEPELRARLLSQMPTYFGSNGTPSSGSLINIIA